MIILRSSKSQTPFLVRSLMDLSNLSKEEQQEYGIHYTTKDGWSGFDIIENDHKNFRLVSLPWRLEHISVTEGEKHPTQPWLKPVQTVTVHSTEILYSLLG